MHLTNKTVLLIVAIIVIIIVVMIVRRNSQSDEDREREEDRFRVLLIVLVVAAVALVAIVLAPIVAYSYVTMDKDHDETGQEYGKLAERRANAVRKKRAQLAEAEAKIGKGAIGGWLAGKRAKKAELKRQSAKKEAARVLMEQP